MRLMPCSYLEPGMKLARDLLGKNNSLLLSAGQALTEQNIQRIKALQYHAVYIRDAFESDEEVIPEKEPEEVVTQRLRSNAVQAIRSFFVHAENDNIRLSQESVLRAKSIIYDMLDEITSQRDATANMTDLKLFDDYTYYHSVNVAVVSMVLGVAMGLSRTTLFRLGLGAMLHDIGKIYVPKEILDKPGKLTPTEFSEVKKHSQKGYEYLKEKWDIPYESNLAILSHHEKYDKSGYPNGVGGDSIPELARIVAVADVFDALTSERPYRKALTPSDAMEYIMGNNGSHFDPRVVDAFLQKVTLYPTGTHVMLSNGVKGVVVKNYPKSAMRPKIRVVTESKDAIYYDLTNDMKLLNLTIVGVCYT